MMKIDSVASQPDRAGRYTIRFEDASILRLYRQTVEDFGLYSGKELDEIEFSRLKKAAGEMSAKMRAVRIVSASNVSKGDLEYRLIHKGENPEDAYKAVAWMTEMDLLDDRKTAEQIVHRCIAKGYGLNRAKQALYEKRIPKHYWQEVLEDYPDQTDAIADFLRNRLGESRDDKQMRKAVDALIRRGHNYGDIRAAMRQLELHDEYLED